MNHRFVRPVGSLIALVLAFTLSAVPFSMASITPITVAQLAGTWTATLSGVTGSGTSTLITTFKLDSTGNGTQIAAVEHTAGCGDIDQTGQAVQIQSLNGDGSGFIAFGCGPGCGFGFYMQVPKNRQLFNLGPQSVPGNYLAGVAVKKNL